MSASGQFQIAVAGIFDATTAPNLWYSIDYGSTWSASYATAPLSALNGCAMSANGQIVAISFYYNNAVSPVNSIGCYISYKGASSSSAFSLITTIPSTYNGKDVAMSDSGKYITFVSDITTGGSSGVYVSSNYGKTFSLASFPLFGYAVDVSASGQYQTISYEGAIYYSYNYGKSWFLSAGDYSTLYGVVCVKMTANGKNQLATGGLNGKIYVSTNHGYTWSSSAEPAGNYTGLAISSNGQFITAMVNSGTYSNIFVSITPYGGLFANIGATGADGASSSGVLVYNTTSSQIYLSTGSKSFVIDHPHDPTQYLVHACLEGPEVGVYYRGKGTVINGNSVQIELPEYVQHIAHNFTIEITTLYNALHKKQVVYRVSPVKNNAFIVHGENGSFYWTVFGERQRLQTTILKNTPIHGDGPYTYVLHMMENA